MTMDRPTLQQLIDRAGADVTTRLPGADVLTRRSNLHVLTRVHAGGVHGLYGYLDYQAKQIFPDTADDPNLERQAGFYGLFRKPAVAAGGQITIYGTSGFSLPAESLLQRSDGARFRVTANTTLSGTSALAPVTAVEAGQAGNTAASTALTLVSPLDGIKSPGLVATGGLTGGADPESSPALLARLIYRLQKPPQGGAGADYWRWVMEVPGVTRAYVYPRRMGAGTVGITFLMDDASYGPIPSADDVARVSAYIHEVDATGHPFRRPVCADVYVFALNALPLDFNIHLSPDTPANRAAVQAELKDLILREAEPEKGLLLSHCQEAISTAPGENDHTLVSPVANPTAGAGQIITMGAITWS
jgi:uncharacterized phage protein gp47/JayE